MELAERRVELSAEYARDSELLEGILEKKAWMWPDIRKGMKSDKSADKQWDASTDGVMEIKLRLRMKASEKKMSAARTLLEVLSGEARNQW
ncbi:MAG: hypothetical protein Q6360_13185 [Candidatus Brocadiales bacterium]|nr:hypothetical protein [Candidatus Brocadiales bacterium]